MTLNKKIICFTFLGYVVLPGQQVAAEEIEYETNFEISVLNEDNISRGFYEIDVHSDQVSLLSIAIKAEYEINRLSALFMTVNYADKQYDEFDKLSSSAMSGRFDYVFQSGYRFVDPVYSLSTSIEESDYGSNLRDSTTLFLGVKVLKRMTTKIKLSGGLSYTVREADTNVFDLESGRLFAMMDYSVSKKLSLYTSYALEDGGSVSTITTSDPDFLAQQIGYATINEADEAGALLPDDVFGGTSAGQFAYQNAAEISILEFGSNYAFNGRNAMDFSVRSINTKLDTGIEYDNFLVQVSFLARF